MPAAFFVRQRGHRLAQERLGRVGGPWPESLARLPATPPEMFFVVDEHRRAYLFHELQDVHAADPELALGYRPLR